MTSLTDCTANPTISSVSVSPATRAKQRWKERNPEYQKQYYEKNKEYITQKKRECREAKSEHYKAVAKARYEAKKETILANAKAFRERSPENVLVGLAKARAKKKNLPFNLEAADIHIPSHCPLLGIELKQNPQVVAEGSPSLDRIVPALGYVKGNVWVVSHKANSIKKAGTLEELELLVANLRKHINAC